MSSVARSWVGFAKRWLGVSAGTPIREVLPFVLPVLNVGADACDGGGMLLVATSTAGAAQRMQAVVTSERGFAVYGARVRFGAPGAWNFIVTDLGGAPASAGPAGSISFSHPPHDVSASVTAEVGAPPASWSRVPVEGASAVNVLQFARPIVVEPNRHFVFGGSGNASTQEVGLFLEEGM